MPDNTNRIETAMSITGDFESAGDPWTALTGNFDNMGISAGVLQWNLGQGTLQELAKGIGERVITHLMPTHGGDFWNTVVRLTTKAAVTWSLQFQRNGNVVGTFARELAAVLGSPEGRAAQMDQCKDVAKWAGTQADAWAGASRGAESGNLTEFCWFFDLRTQQGSLNGLAWADVEKFKKANGLATLLDWLTKGAGGHGRDAARNAALWAGITKTCPDWQTHLLLLGYLRALKAQAAYQRVVMNRRGAIAMKKGWVNSEYEDFSALLP